MKKIIKLPLVLLLVLLWTASMCSAAVVVTPDDDVPPERVSLANNAVAHTQKAIHQLYGITLHSNVEILIHEGSNPDNQDVGGNAVAGKIVIWDEPEYGEYKLAFLIAHELTHQYQIERVGKDALNKNLWFTEGMADLIGVQSAHIYDKDKVRAFMDSVRSRGTAGNFYLSWITQRTAWSDAFNQGLPIYAKADLGVVYLVSRYPAAKLWAYLYALRTYPDADKAMKATYGFSIDALDKQIEQTFQ